MKRREFGERLMKSAVMAGTAGPLVPRPAVAQEVRARRENKFMHVGGDYHSVAGSAITSKENLEYNLRHGVKHLTAQLD